MTDLSTLLEEIVTTTDKVTPREISEEAVDRLTEYEDVLRQVLPTYVRQWLADRRVYKEPVAPVQEESFAPDDLLSDEGQKGQAKKQKTMLRARGSAKVQAIRTEWQRHFNDSLWNGERYIKFGDATSVDLKGAADSLRTTAKAEYAGKINKAEYYEKIADALGDSRKVRDLTQDPTRA